MLRLSLAALGIFSVLNVCISFQFQHTEFKYLAKPRSPACSPAGMQTVLDGSQERGQGQTELLLYSPTEAGCDPQCVEPLIRSRAVASATDSSRVPSNNTRAGLPLSESQVDSSDPLLTSNVNHEPRDIFLPCWGPAGRILMLYHWLTEFRVT